MAAVQECGQFHGGETSTINRRQTQAHDFGKAASQDLWPRMVASGDHRRRSPRRLHARVTCPGGETGNPARDLGAEGRVLGAKSRS